MTTSTAPSTSPAPTVPAALSADRALGLVLLAALAAALLVGLPYWLPWLRVLAYPFRLLTTLVHELSHGLAALLTGGRFQRFVVFADGSGVALTAGGWRFVVIAAGYLGAAGFGAALIRLGAVPGARRWALGVVGVATVALSLRYGLPSLLSEHWPAALLTTASGVLLGGGCAALAFKAGSGWVVFAVHLIAFQAGLAAFSDVIHLIGLSSMGADVANDARSMAELTHLPAVLWAVLWALTAALIFGWALWAAGKRWGREE